VWQGGPGKGQRDGGSGGSEGGSQNRDKDKTSAVRDKLNKRSQQQPDRQLGAGSSEVLGGPFRGGGGGLTPKRKRKSKNNGIDNV